MPKPPTSGFLGVGSNHRSFQEPSAVSPSGFLNRNSDPWKEWLEVSTSVLGRGGERHLGGGRLAAAHGAAERDPPSLRGGQGKREEDGRSSPMVPGSGGIQAASVPGLQAFWGRP